ncbi:MAG: lipid-A-disaccharide synthase [Sulfurimonas sp.]|nr:lipid-A-disaccharide synthase [Sulfurimonas sp.]MBU3939079.1 lipid-A-disaccharide synthase [bacterium]MBU4025599.1 lipid-A-disaccharide synthase [bacterium]MBU4058044.1 lipid-A-disaccharide synthase [bacterium]MBU4109905.1 lipid-A-disaccharide synthase [bacterium]
MKILVSALEHSANVHLKSLKKELGDDVELLGIFDAELGTPIVDLRSLAIMGFVDVFKKLRFFFKLNTQMADLSAEADKVLLIDSSGFNLPLAKKIKKRYPQKEIIYYILPQAWAWKKKRIPVLERTIDKLASILPFEKDYYSKAAPITYVGHPLLDQIQKFKTQLNETIKDVVFMPGSRKGEISKLMPIFHQVRKALNINAVIIIPKYFSEEERVELYGDLSAFEIQEDAHNALYEADFAFICSGTATLEAALIGTPFILSFIAKPLDYFIATKLVKIEYVGLANIMFLKYKYRTMHPEFLQENVTVENLLQAYREYDRSEFLENSKTLRDYLRNGSAKNVAKMIKA